MSSLSMRIAALTLVLSGCAMTSEHSVANTLNLQQLPLSQTRALVLPEAQALWASTQTCETSRTGYGNTRRAWFLEICQFQNISATSLLGETPSTISYFFLEEQLVQIEISFTSFNNLPSFKNRLSDESQNSLLIDANIATTFLEPLATLRTSNSLAAKVHALAKR